MRDYIVYSVCVCARVCACVCLSVTPSMKSTKFGRSYFVEGFSEGEEIWQLDRGGFYCTSAPNFVNFGSQGVPLVSQNTEWCKQL